MRKRIPANREKRTVTRFLFTPLTLYRPDGETKERRWMETATYIEQFHYDSMDCCTPVGWFPKQWVD